MIEIAANTTTVVIKEARPNATMFGACDGCMID
jgi:hypothetical protein